MRGSEPSLRTNGVVHTGLSDEEMREGNLEFESTVEIFEEYLSFFDYIVAKMRLFAGQ